MLEKPQNQCGGVHIARVCSIEYCNSLQIFGHWILLLPFNFFNLELQKLK